MVRTRHRRHLARVWIGRGLFAALAVSAITGCAGSNNNANLRIENNRLRDELRTKDAKLVAKQTELDATHRQLDVARAISENDLKKLFYPEQVVIDRLTGGANYDDQPGDDGVTVYLRPIDQHGDAIKIAGDVTIQLYDLAEPHDRCLIGEYTIPVDQIGKLWHGKLLTGHYSIKCPWPKRPPKNPEVTVRVTFVDYLTKRVVAAQTTCSVDLPPR